MIATGKTVETKTIDLRGLQCPEPRKRAQFELDLIKEGTLIFLLESPAVWNVERFARKAAFTVERTTHETHYELKVLKPLERTLSKESVFKKILRIFFNERGINKEEAGMGLSDTMMVISTDVLGRDPDIGEIVMKTVLETFAATKEVPGMIFFINAGVKLTTISADILPILKEFEMMGTEIFSCGRCLKHYNLESEIKVGYRGTTSNIVEGLTDYKKIVWI